MTDDVLHLDFETYSEADLKAVGAHIYAAHESTDLLCMAWAFGESDPELWVPGQPLPDAIADHVLMGGIVEAWNAQFERLIWRDVAGPKYGWPVPDLTQYRCIMVRALAMGLPGMLDKAAAALQLQERKDDAGKRVMMQLSKPRKTKQGLVRWTPTTVPHKFKLLYDYCLQDVRTERAVGGRVVKLKPSEQDLWFRDQVINDRGIHIDMPLVEAAQAVVDTQLAKLDAEMKDVTGGEVGRTTNILQLKKWLIEGGLSVTSLDKEHIERLLARDDLTNSQRVAITLRQEAGKTSTAKLDAFENRRGADGAIRGSIQFHGASTGRDAARGVQVQNFPRPTIEPKEIEQAIRAIMTRDAQFVEIMHDQPMTAVSNVLRSIIEARPGKDLVSGDLSQIEARLTAYLPGQQHKIRAFRAYDNRTGPDIYIVGAAGVYVVDPSEITKDDPRRQIGKVSELALGFGGGAGAFASMAKIYRVDVSKMYDTVYEAATPENRERAMMGWEMRGRGSGIGMRGWLASEMVKLAWRDANPQIVKYWDDLNEAAIDALMNPGQTFDVRGLRFRKTGSFLRMILRSGRSLFYPFAHLDNEVMPWRDRDGNTVRKPTVKFWGVDGYTRQWTKQKAYGGFFCQQDVQATARDVMWDGVLRTEAAGYENVMRVHDELVSEIDEGKADKDQFLDLMSQTPSYLPGCPIAASGWAGKRYRK